MKTARNRLPAENSSSGPLLCWDIFMEGYLRTIQLLDNAEVLDKIAQKQGWQHNWNFKEKIVKEGNVVLATNTSFEIVFSSINIQLMNGYVPDELIGKNPRMFQGLDSSNETKDIIRAAISDNKPFHVSILNYKKNGDTYWCNIHGYPVFNKAGQVVSFIAFEKAS